MGAWVARISLAMISCWVALDAYALQLGDRREVDEMARRGEAQLHHRDQAVAAGDHARVGIEPAQEADRFGEIGGPVIIECAGNQGRSPMSIRCERIPLAT